VNESHVKSKLCFLHETSPAGKKLHTYYSREYTEFVQKSVELRKSRDKTKPSSVLSTIIESKIQIHIG